MTTVCEIREVGDMAYLRAWAAARGVLVEYLGVTLESHAVYGATSGVDTRVCVVHTRSPTLPPVVWRSPFEHEPEVTNGAVATNVPRTDRSTSRRERVATSGGAARHIAGNRMCAVPEDSSS